MNDFPDLNQIPEHMLDAWQERIALAESLLDETIGHYDKKKLRQEYIEKHDISERTIRNYLAWYRAKGQEGLLFYHPMPPSVRIEDQALQAKILELIDARPTRTVRQLRCLLSCMADYNEKMNRISDRTVYRFLLEKGLGKKKRYAMACETSRISYHQFEAPHSLALVQGDARDGIWIAMPDGKKKKTYLFVWVDDYSRKILYAEYYWDEKLPRMEDSFKKMILRWGIPEKIYLDNGNVYSSKHFAWLMMQLKVKKIHHKPYAAYCKGKVEAVQKTIKNDFQGEAGIAGFSSLEELNTAFQAWVEVVYNLRIHTSTGQAPHTRFQSGLPCPINRITDIQWFNALFFMRDNRTITKYGKIKLFGNQYGVKDIAYGTVIEIRYNPFDLKQVYIFIDNKYDQTITPEKLNNQTAPAVPEESKTPPHRVSDESRRFFASLREQYQKTISQDQIAFSKLKQEDSHV